MIEYPSVRINLVAFMESLSSAAHQQQCWIEGKKYPDGSYNNFDMVVHFLFDDSGLAEDALGEIGLSLYDASEAYEVYKVCKAIDAVLDSSDNNESDEFYMKTPGWSEVMELSHSCLTLLRENDAKYQTTSTPGTA